MLKRSPFKSCIRRVLLGGGRSRLLPSIATTTGTLAISLPCSSIAQTTNPAGHGRAYWGFAVCVMTTWQ